VRWTQLPANHNIVPVTAMMIHTCEEIIILEQQFFHSFWPSRLLVFNLLPFFIASFFVCFGSAHHVCQRQPRLRLCGHGGCPLASLPLGNTEVPSPHRWGAEEGCASTKERQASPICFSPFDLAQPKNFFFPLILQQASLQEEEPCQRRRSILSVASGTWGTRAL